MVTGWKEQGDRLCATRTDLVREGKRRSGTIRSGAASPQRLCWLLPRKTPSTIEQGGPRYALCGLLGEQERASMASDSVRRGLS